MKHLGNQSGCFGRGNWVLNLSRTPKAPDLMTTSRGSRLRSSSWHGRERSAGDSLNGSKILGFYRQDPARAGGLASFHQQ